MYVYYVWYVCYDIHLSICPFLHLSLHFCFVCMLGMYLYMCTMYRHFVYYLYVKYMYWSIHLSFYLSIRPPICLCAHVCFVCLLCMYPVYVSRNYSVYGSCVCIWCMYTMYGMYTFISICLSIHSSFHPSILPLIHPFIPICVPSVDSMLYVYYVFIYVFICMGSSYVYCIYCKYIYIYNIYIYILYRSPHSYIQAASYDLCMYTVVKHMEEGQNEVLKYISILA